MTTHLDEKETLQLFQRKPGTNAPAQSVIIEREKSKKVLVGAEATNVGMLHFDGVLHERNTEQQVVMFVATVRVLSVWALPSHRPTAGVRVLR